VVVILHTNYGNLRDVEVIGRHNIERHGGEKEVNKDGKTSRIKGRLVPYTASSNLESLGIFVGNSSFSYYFQFRIHPISYCIFCGIKTS